MPERTGNLASTGRLGIMGMSERARLLGGTLDIESELGKGTTRSTGVKASLASM